MNGFDLSTISSVYVGSTQYSSIYYGSTLIWPTGPQPHDYSLDYFTIESLEDNNTIKIAKAKSPANISLSYSTDDGSTWTDLTISAGQDFTTINTGDKIIFKGINNCFASNWDSYYRFNSSKNFKVYGNVMSLLFGDNFTSNSEFASGTSYNLAGLFYGTTTIIDASNLILPATICVKSCYNGMFRGATNLSHGPKELPGLYGFQDSYSSMFEGCINLEEGPDINLISVSSSCCCQRMFCMNRSSKITTPKMTKSPVIKNLTFEAGSSAVFRDFFKGNGNLVEVTCLITSPTTSLFIDWLTNCSSTGTFYKDSNTTWNSSTSAIPSGWTTQNYVAT